MSRIIPDQETGDDGCASSELEMMGVPVQKKVIPDPDNSENSEAQRDSGNSFQLPHNGAVYAYGTDVVAGTELTKQIGIGVQQSAEAAGFKPDSQPVGWPNLQT